MGVTPALRRRRERAERQRSLLRDQEDASRESPAPADEPTADGDSYSTRKMPENDSFNFD